MTQTATQKGSMKQYHAQIALAITLWAMVAGVSAVLVNVVAR